MQTTLPMSLTLRGCSIDNAAKGPPHGAHVYVDAGCGQMHDQYVAQVSHVGPVFSLAPLIGNARVDKHVDRQRIAQQFWPASAWRNASHRAARVLACQNPGLRPLGRSKLPGIVTDRTLGSSSVSFPAYRNRIGGSFARLTAALVLTLAIIHCLGAITPAFADSPAVQPQSAERGEELGTVVLDLNKRIGTFREWLEQQAETPKLPPDFAQRVARLADLRTKAETSLSARAEYESQFSALLVEFDGALEAFVAGQEETFRRINEMESSLKDGKASMDAAASTSAAAHAQHAQHAKDLLASLLDSGHKAKAIVDSGGTVPPEAQSAAIEADSMKQTAEFLADVSKAQAEQARSAADELAHQLRELKDLRASFQEDFTAAKNARLKASAIGDYRKQIADSSALLAQLEILKKAHRKGRSAIGNTAFRALTDRGPAQAYSNSAASSPPADNRGLELMLKYANQGDPKSLTNPASSTNTSENNSSGVNP